jgi:hypothetical protein
MTPSDASMWALGIGLPCLSAAVLFLANWCHSLNAKIAENSKSIADLRAHTAENYVRSPDVERVETAVAALTIKVDELLKVVHELLGRQAR